MGQVSQPAWILAELFLVCSRQVRKPTPRPANPARCFRNRPVRVLVTGASGYLAVHVTPSLLARGDRVLAWGGPRWRPTSTGDPLQAVAVDLAAVDAPLPDVQPVDAVVWLNTSRTGLDRRQEGFGKGIRKIMHAWRHKHPEIPVYFSPRALHDRELARMPE